MKHNTKLTVEHNKEPAYISVGFRSWKKAPQCFRDHEATSCHTAAISYEVVVPTCGDVAEMNNNEVVQCRYKEKQYLKVIMECLQYCARQGIPPRGNNDGKITSNSSYYYVEKITRILSKD